MSSVPSSHARAKTRIPGEMGVWIFLLGDLLLFGTLFAVFLFYRHYDLATFVQSQLALDQSIGLINTLLLLTSSWFVARAVHRVRDGQASGATRLFFLAMLCGLAFLTDKIIEWSQLIAAGKTLILNDFYMYYFMLTGMHAAHVIIGIMLLYFCWANCRRTMPLDSGKVDFIESCGLFWHLVDLLWIALFALLFLLR